MNRVPAEARIGDRLMRSLRILLLCGGSALVAGCMTLEQAAPVIAAPAPSWYEYSAKFVCGTIGDTPSDQVRLNVGRYLTLVNVHNPSLERPVDLWYKAVVSMRPPELKEPSKFRRATLKEDQALELDCALIKDLVAATTPALIEGWAVIVAPYELNVAPVYTAGSTAAIYPVQSIDVESVRPTRIHWPGKQIEEESKAATTQCPGAEGCCCNVYNTKAGRWFGDCNSAAGLTCRGLVPGRVNTCTPSGQLATAAQLRGTEPPFCGNP